MSGMSDLQEYVMTEEVAASLRCHPRTVQRLAKRLTEAGVINPARLGSHKSAPFRFTEDEVRAIDAALRPAAPQAPPRKRRKRRN